MTSYNINMFTHEIIMITNMFTHEIIMITNMFTHEIIMIIIFIFFQFELCLINFISLS